MKKIFVTLFFVLCVVNCKVVFAYNTAEIASQIENFSTEIAADSGDMEKVLKDAFDYDPRLAIYYKGYSGKYNSVSSKINIIYNNTDVDINDTYIAYNKEEFSDLVTRALLYSDNKLCIVAKNMPTSQISIDDIINGIKNNCPIALMGYKGYEVSTLDTKIGNYSYYVINFKYDFEQTTLTTMKKAVEQKACEIISSNVAKDMPPYRKVFVIHNYIINNCRYADNYNESNDMSVYTAYGALINGSAVCDGYAYAAQLLLNLCNVENIKVSGTSKGEGHAWNLVKLDNEYYHLDLTWDDPVSSDGLDYLEYNYYNLTDEEIGADHSWERGNYPQAKGEFYSYKKTAELIRNDKTKYTEGYTSFESVFGKYQPLIGSKNPNESIEVTESVTQRNIEPESVLDNVNGFKNIININIGNIIYFIYSNVYKILAVLILIIIIKNIFSNK